MNTKKNTTVFQTLTSFCLTPYSLLVCSWALSHTAFLIQLSILLSLSFYHPPPPPPLSYNLSTEFKSRYNPYYLDNNIFLRWSDNFFASCCEVRSFIFFHEYYPKLLASILPKPSQTKKKEKETKKKGNKYPK